MGGEMICMQCNKNLATKGNYCSRCIDRIIEDGGVTLEEMEAAKSILDTLYSQEKEDKK